MAHEAPPQLLDSAQKGSYDWGLPLPGLSDRGPTKDYPDRKSLTSVFEALAGSAGTNACEESTMSTFMAGASQAAADSRWHIIDAEGHALGRLATLTARLLQGKHKPIYTPFMDTGDFVVVVNAAKVKLTGRKEDQKIYRQHSGYEGGLREVRARLVRQRHPERLVEDAVHGMLPKTKLGAAMYRKLKVYAGPDHPHAAQKPTKITKITGREVA
jgi:large subunit ribosomal protein L13